MWDVKIDNLTSATGNVYGVTAMFKNENISGKFSTYNLNTVDWKDLPEDFD